MSAVTREAPYSVRGVACEQLLYTLGAYLTILSRAKHCLTLITCDVSLSRAFVWRHGHLLRRWRCEKEAWILYIMITLHHRVQSGALLWHQQPVITFALLQWPGQLVRYSLISPATYIHFCGVVWRLKTEMHFKTSRSATVHSQLRRAHRNCAITDMIQPRWEPEHGTEWA